MQRARGSYSHGFRRFSSQSVVLNEYTANMRYVPVMLHIHKLQASEPQRQFHCERASPTRASSKFLESNVR